MLKAFLFRFRWISYGVALAVKMWAEIKHTHRVPVTGCQNIDSVFTVAHETVCDRTDWIRILWFQHWPRLFSRLMHDVFSKKVQAVIESLRAGNTTKILCFLHVLRGRARVERMFIRNLYSHSCCPLKWAKTPQVHTKWRKATVTHLNKAVFLNHVILFANANTKRWQVGIR